MSDSDTTQSSPGSEPNVPPDSKCEVACLCKYCTKPFKQGPVKFVFTDRIPRDYGGQRKQAAIYSIANMIIGCVVFFFYYLYLYFTVGRGLLHTDTAKYKSFRHIYMCCTSVVLGFGCGIMTMASTYVHIGRNGRRCIHFILTASGTALYIYGASCVYMYNESVDYTDWKVLQIIFEDMSNHEKVGAISFVLIILSAATGPLAVVPLNILKFLHALLGCLAFIACMGGIFTALINKEVTDMVDDWELFHFYIDTLVIAAVLIVIVLIKPLSNCYMQDYKD